MSEGEAVKVAVRVRPFNSREKSMGAKLIIKMSGSATYITNPEDSSKKDFAFDFSYWSHDGFKEESDGTLVAQGNNYATQRMVYDDLGQGVLNNAFEGYNTSLFAYGQTGSGKSYSMVGYGPNKGIVPITCDELFKAIEGNTDTTKTFEVTFSMLEIYNEQVRDLLVKNNPKGGLHVRQHPSLGFYVDNLRKVPVGSYKEIEARMDEGTKNRTVASTNMNATSSRAHTVVTITFDQVSEADDGSKMKKSSVMNLVDLAGSERAESTGATGDRLKEGANINKSLSALGNVISALAEISTGKGKGKMVPYRDSVLTKLLQNALGGNSKTIMIAALSPADVNYDETLSTLRYADRAKQIKNKATVNESPTDKLIRELREENEKMKKLLEGGGLSLADMEMMKGGEGGGAISEEEREQMKRELEEQIRREMEDNEKKVSRMEGSSQWSSELEEAAQEVTPSEETEQLKKTVPHFTNLNEDIMLSGMVTHFLNKEETIVGRSGDDQEDDIALSGISIKKLHCKILKTDSEILVEPSDENAKVKVNGETLTGPYALKNRDRVLFGHNHLYVFYNPLDQTTREGTPEKIDWEFASLELTKEQGMAWDAENLNREQQRLRQEIAELYPMVGEVNAISEEMNKYKSFDIVLIPDNREGAQNKGATVMIKMSNLLNGNTWLWDKSTFTNRKFIMEEHYQQYSEGDDSVLNIAKEEDPFWEPAEDVLIGVATFYLQPLSYQIEVDDEMPIYDYKGKSEGNLTVGIYPCDKNGKIFEDDYCEDPDELLNKPFHFKIQIRSAEISKTRFVKGVQVRYMVRGDSEEMNACDFIPSLTPKINHERIVAFEKLTISELEYLKNASIAFKVYGKQEDLRSDATKKHMNTKQLRQSEAHKQDGLEASASALMQVLSGDDKKVVAELKILQKKCQTYQNHEEKIKKICQDYSEKDPTPENFSTLLDEITKILTLEDRVKEKVKAIGIAARMLNNVRDESRTNETAPEAKQLFREMTDMVSRMEQTNRELTQRIQDELNTKKAPSKAAAPPSNADQHETQSMGSEKKKKKKKGKKNKKRERADSISSRSSSHSSSDESSSNESRRDSDNNQSSACVIL